MLFGLIGIQGYDGEYPVAIFSCEAAANAAGERLTAEYRDTHPAFSDWCARKIAIERKWKAEGRPLTRFGGITDGDLQEIVRMIGPCPKLKGYESFSVWKFEDQTQVVYGEYASS